MSKHLSYLLLAVALFAVTAACAQDAAALSGTVTFRSGQTLSGIIKEANLGILDGSGIGTSLPGNGGIRISVGGAAVQRIPVANIASIEATWVDKSTPEEPGWEISELKVMTKDGQTLVGKPGWHMHATNVSIELPSGETKRVHAFPLAGPDFKAENLIAKIDLTATASAATIAPAATTPAATAPATEPAATTPAATTPDVTVTPATTETTTPTTTTPATTEAAAPTPATAAPTAAASPGKPVVVTVDVPGSDKKLNILIYVTVADGEVKVTPAQ